MDIRTRLQLHVILYQEMYKAYQDALNVLMNRERFKHYMTNEKNENKVVYNVYNIGTHGTIEDTHHFIQDLKSIVEDEHNNIDLEDLYDKVKVNVLVGETLVEQTLDYHKLSPVDQNIVSRIILEISMDIENKFTALLMSYI